MSAKSIESLRAVRDHFSEVVDRVEGQHKRSCAAPARVSDEGPYELVVTGPASCALTDQLPKAVAAAGVEFLTAALVANPRRVGKPLRDDLAGVWSARRGTYRILYRVLDRPREVVVLRVEHRQDAYRPL